MKAIWKKVLQNPSTELLRQFENIDIWKKIFAGKSDWLEHYEINVDGRRRRQDLKQVNAAKLLCQEFASLVFSEVPTVDTKNAALLSVLEESDFWEKQTEEFERQCALGGQAIKAYVRDGVIGIDYVPADRFIPISWNNKRVTEAAFIDYQTINGKEYIRVEEHKRYYPGFYTPVGDWVESSESKGYGIKSTLYKKEADKITQVEIAGLLPEYAEDAVVDIESPLFVYIKNPIANNWYAESPVGMSLFGNCLDTLKAIDTVFTAIAEDPELCRPRIGVSTDMTRTIINDDGTKSKYFDPSDRVFRAVPAGDNDKPPMQDFTIPLQHTEYRLALQTDLDVLSAQVGLSPGTLSFDNAGGTKTATEIISENSRTYKTRAKYVNGLVECYTEFFKVIAELLALYGTAPIDPDFSIVWDDSIIEDRNANTAYWTLLANSGMIPRYKAVMNILKVDEAEARKIAEEAKAEQAPVINSFGGF